MLTYETFDSIIRTDSCLVAHCDRWDAILGQIEDELEQAEIWAEWQAEVDHDLMIAEWEASESWRSDIETVEGVEDPLPPIDLSELDW